MDNCCLNRPFDDQSNIRNHLESEAIKGIISLCEQGNLKLISSQVLEFEISNTSDELRKSNLLAINGLASMNIEVTEELRQRAKTFESLKIQAFDAMHLACAEENANVILTVDDKFRKNANKIQDLKIRIDNPLRWLEEFLQ